MSDQNKRSQDNDKRKPYEKPAVISEEVFETMALSCAQANVFACPGGNPDRS